jgi:hypothetical protein
MKGRKRIYLVFDRFEGFLIAVAAILLLLGAALWVWLPAWWWGYIHVLDPIYWSSKAWIIATAILLEILVIIRVCGRNKRFCEEMPSGFQDAVKRLVANAILLIALLGIADSMIPWWRLDAFDWYWLRIRWYWTNHWWIKLSPAAFFTAILLILIAIRTCLWWLRNRKAAKHASEHVTLALNDSR